MSFLNFFKEDDKTSMMRLNFFLIIVGCFINIISVGVYIIISAIKCSIAIDWNSMGVFFIGVATIATGVGYNKWKQKQIELKDKENGKEKD